jgi:LysM repeat protein
MKKLLITLMIIGLTLPVTAPAYADHGIGYVVQPGDTLYGIARKFGVSPEAIIAENNLTKPDQLTVGQWLFIPGAVEPRPAIVATRKYVVQRGDTLEKIARRFGASAAAIRAANHIKDPNLIRVGQRLTVSSPISDWTTYDFESSGLGAVSGIATDNQGRVWATTTHGLGVLAADRSLTAITSANSGLADDNLYGGIAVDNQGRVWVGTRKGLSVRAPDGSWTTYTTSNSGLALDEVNALVVDALGRVWVGTDTDTLSMLAPDGNWTDYSTGNESLGDHVWVQTLALDKQGRVWAGRVFVTASEDNFILAGNTVLSVGSADGKWTHYLPTNTPVVGLVRDIAIDTKGRVWVATGDGLSVFVPASGQWATYTSSNSDLGCCTVYAVAVDKRGRVWAGTDFGLSALNPDGSWTTYNIDNTVWALDIDSQGRVWLGTHKGLSVFTPPSP